MSSREDKWRALLETVTAEDRSKFGPGVLLARAVWEAAGELRRIRRLLGRQLEDRGLEEPSIASDLGALARVAGPMLEAVEGLQTAIDGVEATLDRLRLQGDPRR